MRFTDKLKGIRLDHHDVIETQSKIADLVLCTGKVEQGSDILKNIDVNEKCLGENYPDVIKVKLNLARSYKIAGKMEQSFEILLKIEKVCMNIVYDNNEFQFSSPNHGV